MAGKIDRCGYIRVTIVDSSIGFRKTALVHRLVANAFIPNPENKPQVNHIDGNKLNNAVENLEWVTASENMKHAFATKLHKSNIGGNNPASKYDENTVKRICELLNECKYTNKEIAIMTDTNAHLIANIRTGIAWKEISKNYPNISKREYRFAKFHDYVDEQLASGMSHLDITKLLIINEGLTWKEAYNMVYQRLHKRKFNDYSERK